MQQTTIEIHPATRKVYEQADKEIAERLGMSPGAEFLMSLMVQNEQVPSDLADIYCYTILNDIPFAS